MRRFGTLVGTLALAPLMTAQGASANETKWMPALFDLWANVRTGTGSPVYWYSVGTLRSYPDGKLLARVERHDTARSERVSPTLVRQFNRKIYIHRDPVPKMLRDYVEASAPLWKSPPADLADIRRLQAA